MFYEFALVALLGISVYGTYLGFFWTPKEDRS
jgi:hypothetical protein